MRNYFRRKSVKKDDGDVQGDSADEDDEFHDTAEVHSNASI